MGRKGSILVVDDTHNILEMLTLILEAEGYQVRPVDSGKLALASVEAEPPELILLDVIMPEMDGFEILRRLKARSVSRDIPVIFLSAITEVTQRVEGLKLGAVDFIIKPFRREELLARVRTHLELFKLRARLLKQAADLRLANEQLKTEIEERRRAENAARESEAYCRAVTNSASDAIITADVKGDIVGWNRAAETIFGYQEAEIIGQPLIILLPNRHRDSHLAGMNRLQAGGEPHIIGKTVEMEGLRKDGSEFPIELSLAEWEIAMGKYYTAILRDVTKRKWAESQREATLVLLRESERRYRSLFENMLEGFAYCKMLYDDQDRPVDFVFFDVNATFENLLGLSNVERKKATDVIPGIMESNPEIFESYGRVASTGKPERFEVLFKSLNKWLSISVFSTEKGYFVAVFDNVTELHRHQEILEYFAIHDALTGLLNRRSLEDMLNRTIARANRGTKSSLLYIDLDNFKDVNDTVGHSAGDDVLITLIGLLKDELRSGEVFFRIGGDEFAILLEGIDSREALLAAERLRLAIKDFPFNAAGQSFQLSLSIGLIEIDGKLGTAELLTNADNAMYRAKERGKNQVVQAGTGQV